MPQIDEQLTLDKYTVENNTFLDKLN